MAHQSTPKIYIVIPNWNGKHRLKNCLDSINAQSQKCETIVVDNGSVDGSSEYLRKNYPWVHVIQHERNEGFSGGVNAGIKYALNNNAEYVALLNNDAIIEKSWLENLLKCLKKHPELGAVTCKLLSADKKHIDSTGDFYSSWGLTIPRQRDHPTQEAVSSFEYVFGVCAGASLYRVAIFKDVGLFDERFFAYYEDTDFNFRMQLAGWKAGYEPFAEAYHATGSTSGGIKGFTTFQTLKNLPILFWKNTPTSLVPHMLPRFTVTYWAIFASSITHGKGWYALKGLVFCLYNIPYTMVSRYKIQSRKKVSDDYIRSLIVFDLPEKAYKLRSLRTRWWKLRRKI